MASTNADRTRPDCGVAYRHSQSVVRFVCQPHYMHTRWAIRTAVLAVTCLLAAACTMSPFGSENVVKDEKGLALNQKRLSVTVADLNAVTDPPNTHAKKRAVSYGCVVDSGEVFEPGADQGWTLTGPARDNTDPTSVDAKPLTASPLAQRAMEQIAAQLIKRGWSGTARVHHTKDDIYIIDLQRTFDDHTVSLGMQGFSDSILASATTTPEDVCDHSS